MPLFALSDELVFPNPMFACEDGLLAVGGDLSSTRLLLAYESGIFPWYSAPDPILWWSPDPRCVLFTDEVKVSKSMRNVLNQNKFKVTFDQAFMNVMDGCRRVERHGQEGTWITGEIMEAYLNLHELGVGHSVEVWEGETLVGGLYGVSLGHMFFGESMFAERSNASKVALISLCRVLKAEGFKMIDCQIYNDHLGSMGAVHIPRSEFMEELGNSLKAPTLKGDWNLLRSHLK